MLLCDDILFWQFNNEQPVLDGFDRAAYELDCALTYSTNFLKSLRLVPPPDEAFRKLKDEMREDFLQLRIAEFAARQGAVLRPHHLAALRNWKQDLDAYRGRG